MVLHEKKYGFRENRTTELTVNQIVDELIEAGEKKLINCFVFLDLNIEFNTVNHKFLLPKLNSIKDSMLSLLKDYLNNRIQSIVINNVLSEREIVNVGISQGSCLGPLLFLVYINDIFSSTEINMRLFADDACLSYQHSDPKYLNEIINKKLVKVDKWLRAYKLFINYSKTKILLFKKTSKVCEFSIKINSFIIEQSYSIKYLVVVLDDKLIWKKNLNSLKSK